MKRTIAVAVSIATLAVADLESGDSQARRLARESSDGESMKLAAARESLRDLGPAGLSALLEVYDRAAASDLVDQDRLNRLEAAIDAVAAQRDAASSRLYWYTDLDAARSAAERLNRPIVSLRLLGKLTDEYSCANSRFFRAILYPNAEVSSLLRDDFVLHWESVRAAPRITIDFGDGRRLDSTVTGNSVHYVLDAHGRLVDAIPGLYGPQAFLEQLQAALPFAIECSRLCSRSYPQRLRGFHAQRAKAVIEQWRRDLAALRVPPHAGGEDDVSPDDLEASMSDDLWIRIAGRRLPDAKFDETSLRIIERARPAAEDASRLAVTKNRFEAPMLQLVRRLAGDVALDTVRNEYLLHRRIHERLAVETPLGGVGPFNEWVYAALFQTPLDDPWMGLSDPDVFSALENGGRSKRP